MNLTRRELLPMLAAGAASTLLAQARRRPNILFFLADDLGYGDLGCYGQQRIKTPNLDRLAAEGIRFTDAYAGAAVCAPSRCTLMTGLHTGHCRIRSNDSGSGGGSADLSIRATDLTFTEGLHSAGYRTGLIGKWSLGGLGLPGFPARKGFDEFYGYFGQTQAHNYYPELLLHNDREVLLKGNTGGKKSEYGPDLLLKQALAFLSSQPSGQPFFLNFATIVPHANDELGNNTGNGMEVPSDAPYSGETWPPVERNFAASVTRLDSDVGALLELLKKTGQEQDTLVLFASDNGAHNEGGHSSRFFSSSGPLRGIKGALYDGGIRVPWIVRWPGHSPAASVNRDPAAFWDLFPTFAELAGAPIPKGLDGVSLLPAFEGKRAAERPYLYWESPGRGGVAQAVRMGDWKAVRSGRASATELYNVRQDLGESRNLAAEHTDLVARAERYFAEAHAAPE